VAFLGFKEILELIDKVAESGISSVEIESAGVTLRIEGARAEQNVVSYLPASAPAAAPAAPAASAPSPAAAAPAGKAESDLDPSWHIVKSPIVGTFYRSPNPEAEMFVKEGDRVSKGKVLCIIEAMKLMNEIEADADGVVVRVFPQNGQPIEYGEPLFAIKR
jgi:acetyl-CoA carboxylase biotin carboxyl carrier protein